MVARTPDGRDSLPIPTYEEAVSSRPVSSHSHLGAAESSDDAERQGLLSRPHSATYAQRRGRVDGDSSARSSGESSGRSSLEGLRHEMTQMDMGDPLMGPGHVTSSSIRVNLSKRITYLTNTISAISLPFQVQIPSFQSIRDRLPERTTAAIVVVIRLVALLLIALIVYFFASEIKLGRGALRPMYDPESVRTYVTEHVDASRIRDSLEHLTAYDHLAGTQGDYAMAEHVHGLFSSAKLDQIEMNEYHVYLNYPRQSGRRVAIVNPPELAWEAQLEEDYVHESEPATQRQTFVFHGHSRAGNVNGPLIYANYGSREDFRSLKDQGVNVTGSVVLVRYYGTQTDRALKVKAAEMAGAVGCIIYSDPNEDGFRKGKAWPDGRWMPSDGVQRGAVSLMSWVVGDVLTPGWASTKDAPRVSKDDNAGLVNIPSLPLAWRDAQRLLQVLQGYGSRAPQQWIGGVPDVEEWWTGDQTSPVVNLMNEQDEEDKQPIWNVLGSIVGTEQSAKTIIVGNHRDAWCLGAADPGSGTAIMLEVVAVFGELIQLGWRPRRTIQFASWDGEEYNLIGSTEWVEDNMDGLRRNGVAYVNLDTAVTGSRFRAAASPIFQKVLLDVLDRTSDPFRNETLRAIWEETDSRLQGLGAGSDYVAFQDMAGTSSIDFGFDGPGFPYHSCYDNFEWMKTFGDPGFDYHKVLAQVMALFILELSDRPVLPYDFVAYASALQGYVTSLQQDVTNELASSGRNSGDVDLTPLQEAADAFSKDAASFQVWVGEWQQMIDESRGLENNVLAIHRMSHNSRMSNFETHLLDLEDGGGVSNHQLVSRRDA